MRQRPASNPYQTPREADAAKNLLVASEVAHRLRVAISTVYAWVATGCIPSIRVNGIVRFVLADLETWLRQHTRGMNSATGRRQIERSRTSESSPASSVLRASGRRAIRTILHRHPPSLVSPTPSPYDGIREDRPSERRGNKDGHL
jgi:excisionase family DNA binding protein